MRLIDADALKESIVTETLEKDRENLTRRFCYPCREIFTAINKAPTIEERKTGKWLPDNNNYYEERFICSVCGRSYKVDTCMGKPMWDFCPCGAKMEG